MSKLQVGDIFPTNSSGKLKITKYTNCDKVECTFIDTGTVVEAKACHIRRGKVKDRFHRSLYDVGYLGTAKVPTKVKGVRTKQYSHWQNMLMRCYCPKYQRKNPTYVGCYVCPEWHDFGKFCEWFDENYIEGFQLDKDIILKGNKVYSPDTCCFVSGLENTRESFIDRQKVHTLISPSGEVHRFHNVRAFSIEQGLDDSSVSKLLKGKLKSCKKWRLSE